MADYPFLTLPDYLRPGLRLVLIGINPSLYSVEQGHYFARPANRFWSAFSASRLSAPIRAALGRAELGPADDARLIEFGIGLTDVVKRPSRQAGTLRPADYRRGVPDLIDRLTACQPAVACFQGLIGYRQFRRYAALAEADEPALGPRPERIGRTRLFVVPNPSPANARFRTADLAAWFDRLAEFMQPASDESGSA